MKHVFDKVLEGEFVTLRQVRLSDAKDIYKWRTSSVSQYLNQPDNYAIEMQENWIKSRTEDEINYIIYPNDSTEKIGMVGILSLDYHNLVGEVGRLLLDESYVAKSTPYGVETLKITYNYVFNVMGFRKISGTILGRNQKVFGLQTHLGMTQEGYFKKHVILNGKEEDLYFLSLFKEDFSAYSANIDKILKKFRK